MVLVRSTCCGVGARCRRLSWYGVGGTVRTRHASAATCRKQRDGHRSKASFAGCPYAAAPQPAQNSKRVFDYNEKSRDAVRASASAGPKQQEGRGFQKRLSGRSTPAPPAGGVDS